MRTRRHHGFGHGLRPGEDRDINCTSCQAEQAAGTAPVIHGQDASPGESDEIRKAMLQVGQPAIDLAADPEQQRWTTAELRRDFEVIGFCAPFVAVRRRSDGVRGSLEFTHDPRVYFSFKEDEEP